MTALPKVLFVDDDSNLLTGISRSLRGRFDLTLANGPAEGLQRLEEQAYAVIVSDMRMPEMDGTAFLLRARGRQPGAIRMVLSGHSDLEAACGAINDGQIFRFLIKPMGRDELVVAVEAALEQKRLVDAEKELLERTFAGSIDALSETLALTSPEAFGRSRRLKRIVTSLAAEIGLSRRWPLEVAASLSQLGAITLPPEVARRWQEGATLTESERVMVSRAGSIPQQLIRHLPRVEPVVMLLDALSTNGAVSSPSLSLEISILLAGALIERRLEAGKPVEAIVAELESDPATPEVLIAALKRVGNLLFGARSTRAVALMSLTPGMVLTEDVKTKAGALLIGRGHEISDGLLVRLRNFAATVGIQEPLLVAVPEDP
jgi:CheY-like chemotaxis protein